MEIPVASPALMKLEDSDPFDRRDPLLGTPPKLAIEKGEYRLRQQHLAASDPDLIGWRAMLQAREGTFAAETKQEYRDVGFCRRWRVERARAIEPAAPDVVIGIGLLTRGQFSKRNDR